MGIKEELYEPPLFFLVVSKVWFEQEGAQLSVEVDQEVKVEDFDFESKDYM